MTTNVHGDNVFISFSHLLFNNSLFWLCHFRWIIPTTTAWTISHSTKIIEWSLIGMLFARYPPLLRLSTASTYPLIGMTYMETAVIGMRTATTVPFMEATLLILTSTVLHLRPAASAAQQLHPSQLLRPSQLLHSSQHWSQHWSRRMSQQSHSRYVFIGSIMFQQCYFTSVPYNYCIIALLPNQPTWYPTAEPTYYPTAEPTYYPTAEPTWYPTDAPTISDEPTPLTFFPTEQPTITFEPTEEPTISFEPSSLPTLASDLPSSVPSARPSAGSDSPSVVPSPRPSAESDSPSSVPSPRQSAKSDSPSSVPSLRPSAAPSAMPSFNPSLGPSSHPSISDAPSAMPSSRPSKRPTKRPTPAPRPPPKIFRQHGLCDRAAQDLGCRSNIVGIAPIYRRCRSDWSSACCALGYNRQKEEGGSR